MKKHKFNIFPEAKPEDFARLKDDIQKNGFDRTQPITVYQGAILDGWNRENACAQLGATAIYSEFDGNDVDAIAFVMRTNKRRNLSSGQWATIAVEAEDLVSAIRKQVESDRRKAQSETRLSGKKLPDKNDESTKTSAKVAEVFNTNQTYVKQAAKIKQAAPEVFEKVKAGTMTMQDANKAVRAIPTDDWRSDERERQKQVTLGQSVIANAEKDKNLIQWAESKGLAIRIDRGTKFGNPFILDDDGDRDAVCDAYEKSYLPHKPSIKSRVRELTGKVLVCHCYPLRCHGNALIELCGKSN